jgi:hypothetical protein
LSKRISVNPPVDAPRSMQMLSLTLILKESKAFFNFKAPLLTYGIEIFFSLIDFVIFSSLTMTFPSNISELARVLDEKKPRSTKS